MAHVIPSPWNSDHEWTVARVHARWHGRTEPDDIDLTFAQAVLLELAGQPPAVSDSGVPQSVVAAFTAAMADLHLSS